MKFEEVPEIPNKNKYARVSPLLQVLVSFLDSGVKYAKIDFTPGRSSQIRKMIANNKFPIQLFVRDEIYYLERLDEGAK